MTPHNLPQLIEQWLHDHPHATARQAIWAGAIIELTLWCNPPSKA